MVVACDSGGLLYFTSLNLLTSAGAAETLPPLLHSLVLVWRHVTVSVLRCSDVGVDKAVNNAQALRVRLLWICA